VDQAVARGVACATAEVITTRPERVISCSTLAINWSVSMRCIVSLRIRPFATTYLPPPSFLNAPEATIDWTISLADLSKSR
jgi:hypothetical protein